MTDTRDELREELKKTHSLLQVGTVVPHPVWVIDDIAKYYDWLDTYTQAKVDEATDAAEKTTTDIEFKAGINLATIEQLVLERVKNAEIVLRHDIAKAAPPCEHDMNSKDHQAYCGFINRIWTMWAIENDADYGEACQALRKIIGKHDG